MQIEGAADQTRGARTRARPFRPFASPRDQQRMGAQPEIIIAGKIDQRAALAPDAAVAFGLHRPQNPPGPLLIELMKPVGKKGIETGHPI
jgi:hypothetical protein